MLRRVRENSQRVRLVELGRVIADRAAPEALRIERYLTPISNNRYPLADMFLPCAPHTVNSEPSFLSCGHWG